MQVLIDNMDIEEQFGIRILDYTAMLGIASEREDEYIWPVKSGIDKNLGNNRYEPLEFVVECFTKAINEVAAYRLAKALTDYMFEKKLFVLSLRDIEGDVRECLLCKRSRNIVPSVNIRKKDSIYRFSLGLCDVNPNGLKFIETTDLAGNVRIYYDKGRTAKIFWGDGTWEFVSNSKYYYHVYSEPRYADIVVDIDKDMSVIDSLTAQFTSDNTGIGIKPHTVQFTDLSEGRVKIWSWDFGDGNTSAEQNPIHTYTKPGIFTVRLQVFNEAGGTDSEIKTEYITVRFARKLIDNSGAAKLITNNNYKAIT